MLSDGTGGRHFNGPNDISIKSDGAVYLTDNDFGLRGATKSPLEDLEDAVWLIKDGSTVQLLTDKRLGATPNGITLSADEKFLYLSASSKMMRYAVRPDTLKTREQLVQPAKRAVAGTYIGSAWRAAEGLRESPEEDVPPLLMPASRLLGW